MRTTLGLRPAGDAHGHRPRRAHPRLGPVARGGGRSGPSVSCPRVTACPGSRPAADVGAANGKHHGRGQDHGRQESASHQGVPFRAGASVVGHADRDPPWRRAGTGGAHHAPDRRDASPPGVPDARPGPCRARPRTAIVPAMTESYPRLSARTRRFTLGVPRDITIAPDGSRVVFLRSRTGTDPGDVPVGAGRRQRRRAMRGRPAGAHDPRAPTRGRSTATARSSCLRRSVPGGSEHGSRPAGSSRTRRTTA